MEKTRQSQNLVSLLSRGGVFNTESTSFRSTLYNYTICIELVIRYFYVAAIHRAPIFIIFSVNCVLRLQDVLLEKPEPITESCIDPRWKCFQNCLGALDGTYIRVRVPPYEHALLLMAESLEMLLLEETGYEFLPDITIFVMRDIQMVTDSWPYIAPATSGIAWNDTQKMLTIEDEDMWKQICKRIFDKDRATGEHVEAVADILENLDKEQCETKFSCSTDNVQNFLKTTVEQFGVMTQRMGYEHDLAKNRREVYGIIKNIGSLTNRNKLVAASKIVEKPADVDLFLSLPEEMREEYVKMKLEEYSKKTTQKTAQKTTQNLGGHA
ncbi:hypothetical protein POM88_022732 [Heracleum sosnowskyi]|uniref:Uncharacterized protein n=1 Tax=Heracleum sosnowskyi TaxID=360622 RepID=A0AAD8IFJ1_9APIA|nr:hypothetical protein POM88_022732 [Heracleum sosnowskyi]